ncbi:MAG: signal peptidase II [Candidatus Marinimicrobia bacterium]|nr:signal peptidase II [Candidatus Neomarinimicrobiota bacterium]MCF7851142.1 signal peptidase II [Candidatus Neomarinimicrobiota bacterium]MCF7904059.1 signal peptidase II [Candidatus Neomarinimicrobiota bacterium]
MGKRCAKWESNAIKKLLKYLSITAILVILDHATKYWAIVALKGKPAWPQDWTFFRFDYAENYHMIFSLSFIPMPVANALAIVAMGLLFYLLWEYKDKHVIPSVGLAFILGGAFGNIPERFIRGYVVDFISFDWPDWLFFTRWPTFNIADMVVNIGMLLYLGYVFLIEGKENKSKALNEADDA